ncbi:uncharacterized protein JCM10292_007379 [Rhodotorula paludigena]|uniref:uncharacterized protein n=1 Tax=Rhodotorula paludigena TaxID=86838 RepID=UPI0031828CCB
MCGNPCFFFLLTACKPTPVAVMDAQGALRATGVGLLLLQLEDGLRVNLKHALLLSGISATLLGLQYTFVDNHSGMLWTQALASKFVLAAFGTNGVAEWVNRTISEGVLSFLEQASATQHLWAEALTAFTGREGLVFLLAPALAPSTPVRTPQPRAVAPSPPAPAHLRHVKLRRRVHVRALATRPPSATPPSTAQNPPALPDPLNPMFNPSSSDIAAFAATAGNTLSAVDNTFLLPTLDPRSHAKAVRDIDAAS